MARYQLKLAYDGTDFFGFQRQGSTRTVQKVVEETLRELGWHEKTILFAGRTDTGVHASGQVVVFDLDWNHSSEEMLKALNAKLPADVAVCEVKQASAEFHPRYDALSRCYRYEIYHSPVRLPSRDRFAWRYWPAFDAEKLFSAASLLLGKYDFSAFGRAMKPGGSTIREVKKSCWTQTADGWFYEIEANAFLYHMVRRSVYLQVQVALGKITLEQLSAGVRSAEPMRSGLAPAHGLTLYQVNYPQGQGEQVTERRIEIPDDAA